MQTFRLAPMSTGIRGPHRAVAAPPGRHARRRMLVSRALLGPLVLVCLTYPWVWLRFRPTAFVITPRTVEVVWPLKRRQISRAGIRNVRVIDGHAFRREVGWAFRVGAGGCGEASAGCGPAGAGSSRCTFPAPVAWCGSSAAASARGSSRRSGRRSSFVSCCPPIAARGARVNRPPGSPAAALRDNGPADGGSCATGTVGLSLGPRRGRCGMVRSKTIRRFRGGGHGWVTLP